MSDVVNVRRTNSTQCSTGGKFKSGPGNNFLVGARFTDFGWGRVFLVRIWSPVRLAEVMIYYLKIKKKIEILLAVEIFKVIIHNET